MAELRDRRVEASATAATCCKELFQEQKNLATALESVKASSVRVVAMAKKRDAMIAKYEELHKKADVEEEVDQARVGLDARNVLVAELNAGATEVQNNKENVLCRCALRSLHIRFCMMRLAR